MIFSRTVKYISFLVRVRPQVPCSDLYHSGQSVWDFLIGKIRTQCIQLQDERKFGVLWYNHAFTSQVFLRIIEVLNLILGITNSLYFWAMRFRY